jgi:Fe-S-cluster-containing dehydrogenase component
MFIDTDRCTACDDCVRACAAAHDNNPRFIRHGPEHHNLMVANACMHCVDPVCLIGCPTGAIHRTPDGLVVIDDVTCIGCATCANSCPYDNIRMVEIRDERGDFVVDQDTQTPIVKATKCDLCLEQPTGPACQRACPHDALVRMDLRDRKFLADWLAR